MQEIFVSGANGFLGKHLTSKVPGFEAVPHAELKKFNKPFKRFFFCSTYGNMAFHDDDVETVQANVLDLIQVLHTGMKHSFESLVYVSSSSVGLERQTMYSRTKKAAEQILLAYKEKYNLPICIIRPFSITGVGDQKEHLIPTLIRSCIDGEQMNFVPQPTHDFIDVDDVANAMIILSAKRAGGIFEVGNGKSYSNQEVLDIVEKITGKKARVNIVPSLREYDTGEWVSTNPRIRGYGWLPKKQLETSIQEMVSEYERTKN